MGVWTPGPGPTDDDDIFTGNSSPESENGMEGDDVMNGNGGDDSLTGGKGDDTLNGGDGDDTLKGGDGNDTITDAAFADIGTGTVSINAGTGSDTITVVANQEGTIDGGEDTDSLTVAAGFPATSIIGFTITDVEILFTSGVNVVGTIDQFDAFDTIQLNAAQPADMVTLTLADSGTIDLSDELGARAATVFANSGGNTITTGDFGDSIFGAAGADVLRGGDGDDSLNGAEEDDSLTGGKGNDTLRGGAGNDTISAGAGNDSIFEDAFADIGTATVSIDAGSGNDTMTVVANQEGTIDGGDDTDTLIVPGGFPASSIADFTITDVEILFTSGVNVVATVAQLDAFDTIQLNAAQPADMVTLTLADSGTIDLSDEIAGRAAAVFANSGGNTITTGSFDDTVTGAAGADVFKGGNGNDNLNGGDNDDALTGGNGNDTLVGGSGDDTLKGGDGNDTFTDVAFADIGTGTVSINAGSGSDTITIAANQEGAIDGGDDTDSLTVSAGLPATSIIGFTIVDVEILFTSGVNVVGTIDQFDAFDTIQLNAAQPADMVTLTLADSGTIDLSDEIVGRAVTVFASSGGNTITTGDLDDAIIGAAGADVLSGGHGNDTLNGAIGDDVLTGGDGNDTLTGSAGNDTFSGGSGDDSITDADGIGTVAIAAGSGADTITLRADQSGAVAGGDDTDTLVVSGGNSLTAFVVTNIENLFTSGASITARRAQFDAFDTIQFNAAQPAAAVTLTLADSGTIDLSDELAGRAATVFASASGNTITTGDLNDTVTGAAGTDVLKGGDGDDTLSGNGNSDRLIGGRDDDTLAGGIGDDALKGGKGNDTITGGDGKDTLAGSAGDDRFVYAAAADSTSVNFDTLKKADFAADLWDVQGTITGIDAAIISGKLTTAQFDAQLAVRADATHLLAQHAVIFTPTTGNLAGTTFMVVDQNGVAGYQAGADLVIELKAPKHLGNIDAGDFV